MIINRRFVVIILVCLLMGSTASPSFAKSKEAQELIDKGNEFYKAERYAEAIESYNAAINLDPENILAWENLGWAYWRSGETNQAFNTWDNLLSLHLNDSDVINRIASIYGNVYEYDRALGLFERSLSTKPDQKEAPFGIVKVYMRMGDYRKAYDKTLPLRKRYPEEDTLRLLATILEKLARHNEAAEVWQELSKMKPSSLEYRLNIALNQFRAGHRKEAAALAKQLLNEKPDYVEAMRLLAEEAAARGDLSQAQWAFSEILKYTPQDINALDRLGDVSMLLKDYDSTIKYSSLSLSKDSLQYDEYMKRAEAYFEKGVYNNAIKDYEFILSRNAHNERARTGLLWIYVKQRSQKKALEMIRAIRSDLPKGDVHADMTFATVNMALDNYTEAIEAVKSYRESLSGGIITSLLYHGIGPDTGDPERIYVSDFRQDIEMLKEMGYIAITIADIIEHYQNGVSLPQKPILITFDDARRDSFTFADPILKEFGFKATMFVPISAMKRSPEIFLSFKELKTMLDSGRWDIQSHGLNAHDPIPIDASGRKGDFLTNKKWVDDKNRLETEGEFYERLKQDYRESKEVLEKEIPGVKVLAYAFPRGNFGQIGFTNYPASMEMNLKLVKEFYEFGLYQNIYGQYILHKDYMFIQRFRVKPAVKTNELRKHLREHNLQHKTLLILAESYIWSRKFDEAQKVMDEIPHKESDAHYHALAGLLDAEKGEREKAEEEFNAALRLDENNDKARKGLDSLRHRLKPRIVPQFLYFKDNRKREKEKYSTHLYHNLTRAVGLHLSCERAFFDDKGFGSVNENQGFVELSYYPSPGRGIAASSKTRVFSNDNEVFGYRVTGEVPFGEKVAASLAFERDSIDTARGILSGIRYYRSRVYVGMPATEPVSASLRYEHDWYNDDNDKDYIGLLIMGRLREESPQVFLGYSYRWANSKFDAPAYYTPLDLSAHEANLRAVLSKGGLKLTQNCIIGYGEEANVKRMTSAFTTNVRFTVKTGLDIFVQTAFGRTPTYRSKEISCGIEYRF